MLFVELRFFYFLAAVLAVHWCLRSHTGRKLWLLAVSYAFYAVWDWRFLSLIAFSTAVDYLVGWRLSESTDLRRRRALVATSLIANLGLLGVFKYYDFFGDSLVALAARAGLPLSHTTLDLVLPVGISFYTFQSLSYTLDVYRGRIPATRNLLDFALFVGFFPQLVAGPIVRAADFLPQLTRVRVRGDVPIRACAALFLVGFFKKACVSDNLSPLVDAYFADPSGATAGAAWVAIVAYAAQIYCDFSGYSDMAIACAGLLGYRLCANFDGPYLSASVSEFWRRWHISLSSWLRDYLYISLGGNRGTRAFVYRNLMLTMLLGGLWHGAAATFVVWGGLHGLALVVHREWQRLGGEGRLPHFVCVALTFYWVCLTWIFFRAENLSDAAVAVRSFLWLESPGAGPASPLAACALLALAAAHALARTRPLGEWWQPLPPALFAAVYGALFAVAWSLAPTGLTPFIYFQF